MKITTVSHWSGFTGPIKMPWKYIKSARWGVERAEGASIWWRGRRSLRSGCAGCLLMCLFKVVPMRPMLAVSDFGGRSWRWFSSKLFWRPQGPLIRTYGLCLDAAFHGGFNYNIGGRVRYRRPEILSFFTAAAQLAHTYFIIWDCTYTLTSICMWGEGG